MDSPPRKEVRPMASLCIHKEDPPTPMDSRQRHRENMSTRPSSLNLSRMANQDSPWPRWLR